MGWPLIDEGFAALRVGDAVAARRAFELALAEVESGEALEVLAEALYVEREFSAAAAHYARAYAVYRREGDSMSAGRAARTVAWVTGNALGDWAIGRSGADGSRAPVASSGRRVRIDPSTAGC